MAAQKNEDALLVYDLAYRDATPSTELRYGLDDALAHGRVLTVSGDRVALDVARQADDVQADAVVVLGAQHEIVGYVIPEWIRTQLQRERNVRAQTLTEAVKVLAQEPLDSGRTHLHEWLNYARPQPRTCPGNPPYEMAHITLGPVPCSRHRL